MTSRKFGPVTSAHLWSWLVQTVDWIAQSNSLPIEEADYRRLVDNIVLFARMLRRAGMTVGTGQILDLTRALDVIDVGNRDDVYHTARVVLVGRREDLQVFDVLFNLFWSARTARILQQNAAETTTFKNYDDVIEDCVPDQDNPDDAIPRIVELAYQELEAGEDEDEPEEEESDRRVLLAYSRD